jgi:sugar phosphate isomerase/epimerase
MKQPTNRRQALQKIAAVPLLAGSALSGVVPVPARPAARNGRQNLKTSLNAYSFNKPLREGTMSMGELLEFCSETGFEAVDITAYYFPGYPEVPSDAYLYEVKRKAFRLGLVISGTGVRNDFTHTDKKKRQESIQLVKNWVVAAEKIGAPVLRVFAGHQDHPGYSWDAVAEWMIEDLKACVEIGKEHGVMIGLQNHNGFLKTAAQVKRILRAVDDEWFGLILDIGSFRQGDAFQEISEAIPYAVSWQLKENMYVNDEEVKTDISRLIKIIKSSDYKGYIPIETLGPGDPKQKVKALFDEVSRALG